MSFKHHKQMSESFLTAAFLSVSGGLQDAYTYIFRGKVFANAQTGNIVLLSQSIIDKDFVRAIHYLVPLLFFALGIAIAECIHVKFQRIQHIHWRQLVLVLEILLLLVVGFLPTRLNLLANAMVSFSCAMQVQSFRKVNGYAFASTMCIGNIRSGTDALCAFIRTRDKHSAQIPVLLGNHFTLCHRCRYRRLRHYNFRHANHMDFLYASSDRISYDVHQRRTDRTYGTDGTLNKPTSFHFYLSFISHRQYYL